MNLARANQNPHSLKHGRLASAIKRRDGRERGIFDSPRHNTKIDIKKFFNCNSKERTLKVWEFRGREPGVSRVQP